jgi:hypothetical protein
MRSSDSPLDLQAHTIVAGFFKSQANQWGVSHDYIDDNFKNILQDFAEREMKIAPGVKTSPRQVYDFLKIRYDSMDAAQNTASRTLAKVERRIIRGDRYNAKMLNELANFNGLPDSARGQIEKWVAERALSKEKEVKELEWVASFVAGAVLKDATRNRPLEIAADVVSLGESERKYGKYAYSLSQKIRRSSLSGNENSGDLDTAKELLLELDDDKRNLVYRIIAERFPGDDKGKGVVMKLGEQLYRRTEDIFHWFKRDRSKEWLEHLEEKISWAREGRLYHYDEGHVGFDGFGYFLEEGKEPLPNSHKATEKEVLRDYIKPLREFKLAQEIKNLRKGIIDPVRGDNFFTDKILYPFTEQVPNMALAASPYTLPILASSTIGMRHEELMEEGLSAEQARKVASISAFIEVPLEMLEQRLIFGKIPGIRRVFRAPSQYGAQAFSRIPALFTGEMTFNILQESAQDYSPKVIQELLGYFDKEMPSPDWMSWGEFAKYAWDTGLALLPAMIAGTHFAAVKDRSFLRDAKILRATGFTDEAIEKIHLAEIAMGEGKMSSEDVDALYGQLYGSKESRDFGAESALTARKELADEDRKNWESEIKKRAQIGVHVGSGKYFVTDENGVRIVENVANFEEAAGVRDSVNKQIEGELAAIHEKDPTPWQSRADAIFGRIARHSGKQWGGVASDEAQPIASEDAKDEEAEIDRAVEAEAPNWQALKTPDAEVEVVQVEQSPINITGSTKGSLSRIIEHWKSIFKVRDKGHVEIVNADSQKTILVGKDAINESLHMPSQTSRHDKRAVVAAIPKIVEKAVLLEEGVTKEGGYSKASKKAGAKRSHIFYAPVSVARKDGKSNEYITRIVVLETHQGTSTTWSVNSVQIGSAASHQKLSPKGASLNRVGGGTGVSHAELARHVKRLFTKTKMEHSSRLRKLPKKGEAERASRGSPDEVDVAAFVESLAVDAADAEDAQIGAAGGGTLGMPVGATTAPTAPRADLTALTDSLASVRTAYSKISSLSGNPDYDAARNNGDKAAAGRVVAAAIASGKLDLAELKRSGADVVFALDAASMGGQNALPLEFGRVLGARLGLPVVTPDSSAKAALGKGASDVQRMSRSVEFALAPGSLKGKKVLIADDVYRSGETMLAAMGAVKKAGGTPVMAVALAHSTSGNGLKPTPGRVRALLDLLGHDDISGFVSEFGFSPNQLTDSVLRKLTSQNLADNKADKARNLLYSFLEAQANGVESTPGGLENKRNSSRILNEARMVYNMPIHVRPGEGAGAAQVIDKISQVIQLIGGSGTIRVGKNRSRRSLGEYWLREKVSRIRTANDVSTAAHEGGHAFQDAIWGIGQLGEHPSRRREVNLASRELEAALEHVFAQHGAAKGAARGDARRIAKLIRERYKQYGGKATFRGGVFLVARGESANGGVFFDARDGSLVVDLHHLAVERHNLTTERVRILVQEEAIHAIVTNNIGAVEARQIWAMLPDATRRDVQAAYSGSAEMDAYSGAHEFLRMVIQGRVNMRKLGKALISEGTEPKGIIEKIAEVLKRIVDYVRDLKSALVANGATMEDADALDVRVGELERAIQGIEDEAARALESGEAAELSHVQRLNAEMKKPFKEVLGAAVDSLASFRGTSSQLDAVLQGIENLIKVNTGTRRANLRIITNRLDMAFQGRFDAAALEALAQRLFSPDASSLSTTHGPASSAAQRSQNVLRQLHDAVRVRRDALYNSPAEAQARKAKAEADAAALDEQQAREAKEQAEHEAEMAELAEEARRDAEDGIGADGLPDFEKMSEDSLADFLEQTTEASEEYPKGVTLSADGMWEIHDTLKKRFKFLARDEAMEDLPLWRDLAERAWLEKMEVADRGTGADTDLRSLMRRKGWRIPLLVRGLQGEIDALKEQIPPTQRGQFFITPTDAVAGAVEFARLRERLEIDEGFSQFDTQNAFLSALEQMLLGVEILPQRKVDFAEEGQADKSGRVVAPVAISPTAGLDKMSPGKAAKWVKQRFMGLAFDNADTRWRIGVSSDGAGHAATQSRGVGRRALESLDALLENAIWLGRVRNSKPKGNNKNIRWFHHFYAPFEMGGRHYVAKLTVKETLDGERFYDMSSSEIEMLPRPMGQGPKPPTAASRTIVKLAEDVKQLWPDDAIDLTEPRNERREKFGPRVDFADDADASSSGLDDAEKAAVLERVRGAFPWLFGNYDILLGDLNRALRERGYTGPIPDAALAARLGVSEQARRVRGERDLIVIASRAWDEQGRGAALLMHEAAHAFMGRLPDSTLNELRELWRKEIERRTGPLYTAGELNSPLAHVEENSERGFKEWFAERVARINGAWARARLEGRAAEFSREERMSLIWRLARAFRDALHRAWESFSGLFRGEASVEQRELFEQKFRQWLVDGEAALHSREPRTAQTIYGSRHRNGNIGGDGSLERADRSRALSLRMEGTSGIAEPRTAREAQIIYGKRQFGNDLVDLDDRGRSVPALNTEPAFGEEAQKELGDVREMDMASAVAAIDAIRGKPLTNLETGIVAVVNREQRDKLVSATAQKKSLRVCSISFLTGVIK